MILGVRSGVLTQKKVTARASFSGGGRRDRSKQYLKELAALARLARTHEKPAGKAYTEKARRKSTKKKE